MADDNTPALLGFDTNRHFGQLKPVREVDMSLHGLGPGTAPVSRERWGVLGGSCWTEAFVCIVLVGAPHWQVKHVLRIYHH